ncbi:MAG: hypothetical protein AB2A00_31510 [Myxococcota bacterium]
MVRPASVVITVCLMSPAVSPAAAPPETVPRPSAEETQVYPQHVATRLQELEVRMRELERNVATQAQPGPRARWQTELRGLSSEVTELRTLASRLQGTTGARWVALHDEIELRLDALSRRVRELGMDMEEERPGARRGDGVTVGGAFIPATTPYAVHALNRLKDLETRVDALQKAAGSEGPLVQESIKNVVAEIREHILDMAERARGLTDAHGPQWVTLHDDIEAALREMEDDYTDAFFMLRPENRPGASARDAAPGRTAFSRHALDRLARLRTAVDELERASRSESAEVRTSVRETAQDLRTRISDVEGRVRAHDQASGEEATALEDEVERSIHALRNEYRAAAARLGPETQKRLPPG